MGYLILIVFFVVVFCWVLPRQFNKYVYCKYSVKNPIKMVNGLIAAVIFVVLFFIWVLICVIFNIEYEEGRDRYIMIALIVLASIFAAKDVLIIKEMSIYLQTAGWFLSFTSSLVSIFALLSLFNTITSKEKSTITKSKDSAITAFTVFAFRPDLSENDFNCLDEKKKATIIKND